MPEEIMIIAIVAIVMGTVVSLTKQILDYMRERRQGSLPTGEGVRTSDLRQLMVEAVEEANAPLQERIERLETRFDVVEVPRLPAPERTGERIPVEAASRTR